jgi:hypothetical protein
MIDPQGVLDYLRNFFAFLRQRETARFTQQIPGSQVRSFLLFCLRRGPLPERTGLMVASATTTSLWGSVFWSKAVRTDSIQAGKIISFPLSLRRLANYAPGEATLPEITDKTREDDTPIFWSRARRTAAMIDADRAKRLLLFASRSRQMSIDRSDWYRVLSSATLSFPPVRSQLATSPPMSSPTPD